MCSRVRIGIPILTVLLGAASLPSPVAGQDSAAVTATMLRALAEAADEFRTGRDVFLVGDYRFPYNISGPFTTRAAAERVRADSGAYFGVFGPYRTPADRRSDSARRVVRVTLVTESAQGKRQTIEVDPTVVDALFFTQSAMDKFVIPYYSRLYGPQYATVLQGRNPVGYDICHVKSHVCYPVPVKGYALIDAWQPEWGPPVPGVLPAAAGGPAPPRGSPEPTGPVTPP
jgi:hypothetical protein